MNDDQANGQCGWCLQRERQAFALICPEHISDWRNPLDEMQRDIQALCRAVGGFDGARPESPQVVLEICTQRVERLQRERDAMQARAERLEARMAEIRDGIGAYRYWRTNDDVMMYSCRFCPSSRPAAGTEGPHQHHRICVLNPDYESGMQAARDEFDARAALAAAPEARDE